MQRACWHQAALVLGWVALWSLTASGANVDNAAANDQDGQLICLLSGTDHGVGCILARDGTCVCALDAVTGQPKWLNDKSGHADPVLRKGVSAQGVLAIAQGRLWMAGSNVISPAAYDLKTGKYLSGASGNGSPRFNRGEEVAVLGDRFIIQGGRLRFSAVRNYVNPGVFAARALRADGTLGPPIRLSNGKIEPVWDGELFVRADGMNRPPECFRLTELVRTAKPGAARKRLAQQNKKTQAVPWTAMALRGSDVRSPALAKNAVVAVCQSWRPRNRLPFWRVCVLDRANGALVTQSNLPSEPIPGALAIARDGRILVTLQDGGMVCLGGK